MEPEGSLPRSQVPATCPYTCPQLDPVHTPTSYFLKTHLNIILPSTPGFPKWSLFLSFPHQNPVYASPLPHTHYMPCPSHSSRFYHPNNFGWGVPKSLILASMSRLSWQIHTLVMQLAHVGSGRLLVHSWSTLCDVLLTATDLQAQKRISLSGAEPHTSATLDLSQCHVVGHTHVT